MVSTDDPTGWSGTARRIGENAGFLFFRDRLLFILRFMRDFGLRLVCPRLPCIGRADLRVFR